MTDPGLFHQSTAVSCFNRCWELILKPARSRLEDEEMRRLSEVSYYHWTQHSAFDAEKDSIGLWQLARVYAISGLLPQARVYAARCLEVSLTGGFSAYLMGYAYEGLARCAALNGNIEEAEEALRKGEEYLGRVEDAESASYLNSDLAEIRGILAG